jgi:hypothetical protein
MEGSRWTMEGEAIRFYCGVSEQQWNRHAVAPGPFACISPVYGKTTARKQMSYVRIPAGTKVLQDSGAFSDGPGQRLGFAEALRRQEAHAERFGYADQLEARASYDLLIDERWSEQEANGIWVRAKRRWSETQAEEAVEETVQAARYVHQHRNGLACVLSLQGVTARHYRRCAERILPFLREGDLIGLGGWCLTGKLPAHIMPVFRETMYSLIPFLGREGVRRVHLWGVCYAAALGELLWVCDQEGIQLSTDSIGPSVRPALGRWGYAEWRDRAYRRVNEESEQWGLVKGYDGSWLPARAACGIHRAVHVQQTCAWLAHFRSTRHYPRQEPRWLLQPRQLILL